MKKDTHPKNFRPVVFVDASSGEKFLIDSTAQTDETTTYEGKEYPMFTVEISSASHPFYTGAEKNIDRTGRAEKFKQRMARAQSAKK